MNGLTGKPHRQNLLPKVYEFENSVDRSQNTEFRNAVIRRNIHLTKIDPDYRDVP